MKKDKYTEEELYELLWQKAEELEKVPGARDINNDPSLPDYEVFKKCFGKFRKSKRLKTLVKKFQLLQRKNHCFCIDCAQDETKCEKNVLECKENFSKLELKPYFAIFDDIIY